MKRNLALLFTILVATICGCGGGTSTPPAIAVTLNTMPPAMLAPGGTASVAATVTNDAANGGVKWSCTPASTCGSFNPASTASAGMTTYTAPAMVPSGGSVTMIATSVTDSSKSASAVVTISTNITVTLSTMPPASLVTGGTASVAATVTNDIVPPAGVNWSCTPASACGSFNPMMTASAAMTTYTAPATPPSGGSVMIIATSVTDSTKSASAPVIISGTASNSTLKGQYAFLIRAPTGNPSSRGTTTFIGSVNLDGNGNLVAVPVQSAACTVTCAGMEDIVATKYFDQADPILPTAAPSGSTYSVDASGHGTMTIVTHMGETLSFSFVLTSASHAVIMETNGEPGSGTLDLQSGPFTVAQISGAYAFSLEGVDPAVPPTAKLSFGGVFSSDGAGNITSGTFDVNSNGVVTPSQAFTGTVFQTPDTNGRGTFTVIPPAPAPTRTFTFYMISPKVLRLFESDNVDLMGGSAYAQGSAAAALPSNLVFEHSGWSTTGRTVAAGQCATNGTTTVTSGVSDANAGGAPPTVPSTAKAVSGTFSIVGKTGTLNLTDAAGASKFNVYLVDPTVNILDPNNSTGGGGALLLHTDANIIGTGILIPQVLPTPAGIVASQAINLRNSIAAPAPNELDLVGVVTSDGAGNFKSGLADYDQDLDYTALGPMNNAPFTGTYLADNANAGHFTGSFSIPLPAGGYTFIPPAVAIFNFSLYQASGSQALVIQTDTTANISGYLIQQRLP